MTLRLLAHIVVVFCAVPVFGQPMFNENVLNDPKAHAQELEKAFKIVTTKKVNPKSVRGAAAIENGYAQYELRGAENWYKVKEEAKVKEINIVFSRYPRDFQLWQTNFHELLANRLKALFEIDPALNDRSLNYALVLQTECETEDDAKKLFHGILIKYDKLTKKELLDKEKERKEKLALGAKPDYAGARSRVTRYMKNAGGMLDSSVYKALERNPNWKDALCVVDWTSSMYQYSAQCLAWHLDNIDTSGIKYFAFFNDGDAKLEYEKKVGETGGIYFSESDNMDRVVRVFNNAMRKGLGGEVPENDVEAILKSIEKYPTFTDLILIADNSPMRDFDLWAEIKHPVRVIVADDWTVNPEYLNLAYLTGGSFHTGKSDFYFDGANQGDTLIKVSGISFIFDPELNLFVCEDKNQCRYMEQELAAREKKNLEELKTKPIYRSMHKDKEQKKGIAGWFQRKF